MGGFKPRGASNRTLSVVAASGGDHGAAVACAARALGARAEIFVPGIAGAAKRSLIAGHGARLVAGGAAYDEARVASGRRAAGTGALPVHASGQPEVLAGQGTVAAEFEEDAPDLTHLPVATGGGGLVGGIAAWHAGGGVQVVGVEPEYRPALFEALRAGRPVPAPVGGVAADPPGARQVGALAFAAACGGDRAGARRGDSGGAAGAPGSGAGGGVAVRGMDGAGAGAGGRGGVRRQLRAGERGMRRPARPAASLSKTERAALDLPKPLRGATPAGARWSLASEVTNG